MDTQTARISFFSLSMKNFQVIFSSGFSGNSLDYVINREGVARFTQVSHICK